MNVLKTLLAGAALAASQQAGANAATYYADKVIDANLGSCTTCADPARQDANRALNIGDSKFYSMGLGGDLTVGFSKPLFFPDRNVSVFEITYNRTIGHNEAVDVYSILGGVPTYLGRILNDVASSSVKATSAFEYIRLVDVTLDEFPSASGDGFDVDSISVAPVLPLTAGLMLLAGVGGLAAMRRRKKAA
jgi:hypothetical protein